MQFLVDVIARSPVKFFLPNTLQHWKGGGGGGVRWISSNRDNQQMFLGSEIFDSGIFLGRKIWQVFFGVA